MLRPPLDYEVLSVLSRGNQTFEDFLERGIPKKPLQNTLKVLEDRKYVKRKITMTHPIGAEYSITEKGREEFKETVLNNVPHVGNYLDDFVLVDPKRAKKLLSTFKLE